jgi:hypothetical protein
MYFTRRRTYIYDNISLNSTENEKYIGDKIVEKIKTLFFVKKPFSEKRAVCGIIWKNL